MFMLHFDDNNCLVCILLLNKNRKMDLLGIVGDSLTSVFVIIIIHFQLNIRAAYSGIWRVTVL